MNFRGKFSDHILPDKIHSLNLSFLVDEMEKTRGGTAGNMAYNLGLLGCAPVLLSAFGKDGGEYREFLKKNGVNVSQAPISEKYFSSQSFVVTDETDNQIASFYAGAMGENEKLYIDKFFVETRHGASHEKDSPTRSDLKNRAHVLREGETRISASLRENLFIIISPNTPAAMRNFVNECVRNKIPYMYDPGMQLPRISDADLKTGIENCEILIGNDYEIELMKKRVGDLKPPILIVTLGEKGAVVFQNPSVETRNCASLHTKTHEQHVINPAKPCKTVDPTGAGDAFRAGFLAGYTGTFAMTNMAKNKENNKKEHRNFCGNFDLKTCGRMGATCAVYTVEKYGTTTHEFSVQEFCERYEKNYDQKINV